MLLSFIMWSMYFIGETLSRGGTTRSYYWNQFLGKILSFTIPTNDPPNPIISRTAKSHSRKRLLLLGLINDYYKAASVTNIVLSGESMLNMKLEESQMQGCQTENMQVE